MSKKLIRILALLFACPLLLSACTAPPDAPTTPTTPTTEAYAGPDPAADDTINLLMIGNSGCYYFVEELYGLAEAAGIKMRVCNVYYSGCTLNQHWTWWKNGEANYQFYTTDENGRVLTADGCTLEYCLKQQNWDFISLQEGGTGKLRSLSVEAFLKDRKAYLDDLIGYIREQYPKATLLWQENGAYQVGYDVSFQVNSLEDQENDARNFRALALAVSEAYGIDWIPRGGASMIMRRNGYDTLCARLGKGDPLHSGDNYHDGDIGGGQYLTAGVWLEKLTGQSCVGNSYRPEYVYQGQKFYLEEDLIMQLQEAAHQAVAEQYSN